MSKKSKYTVTLYPSKTLAVANVFCIETGSPRKAIQIAKDKLSKRWGVSPHHIVLVSCEASENYGTTSEINIIDENSIKKE